MKKKRIYQTAIAAALLLVVFGVLVVTKKVRITPLLAGKYEINGVDVSHYQGTIDWPVLAAQNLDFAFIKATEGSGHIDECFQENWQAARETDLLIGAYHFFSFDSAGKTQAQFYIDTVGNLEGKLAPAVDVEFYGDKSGDPPPKEEVVKELRELLSAWEEQYQVKPVIYTTYQAYHRYIKDEFTDYPLWIRNVYYEPLLTANTWTFWQYSDTAVLEGYQGAESCIDRNVFRGTKEELREFTVSCAEGTPPMEAESPEEGVASAEERKWKEPNCFTVWDEEEKKEENVPLEYCNLLYETEQVGLYSYLGMTPTLFIVTPEGETVYPVKNFWVDQEREAVWLLEEEEGIQVRKIDLSPEHFPEEPVLLDRDGLETLLAETYGISGQAGQETFGDLHVSLFCQKEEGKLFLGGRFSGRSKETGRAFEIVYEIDRESEAVSARGYLQDLAIAPLFQEFLVHNLTVSNPMKQETGLGENLSFFDDEIYGAKEGAFVKQFAVVDNGENGEQELFFRLKQVEGGAEWIYVLAEEKDRLVCRDILQPDLPDKPKEHMAAQRYQMEEARWLDCASFFEIPTENCKEYRSREEVFAAVEEGDFSVVERKPFDPEKLAEELEMAYGDGISSRTIRCDIDGDGFEELLLLNQYKYEEWERIDFILDYRNGGAVCLYYDWCDGMEWLLLGKDNRLVHCSCSNSSDCTYYGFQECTLNARGIKEIDYIGNGVEACNVHQRGEEGQGFWWWSGQQPEITEDGVYFTRTYKENTAEGSKIKKELISREEFAEAFTELTGEERVWDKIMTDGD